MLRLKGFTLLLINIFFLNTMIAQIQSKETIRYFINETIDSSNVPKNIITDTCLLFWEEYDRLGRVVKKQDFPSDVCWVNHGLWEYEYFYDSYGRLTEEREYGIRDTGNVLLKNYFYSYPYLNEPHKAIELYINYDSRTHDIKHFIIDTLDLTPKEKRLYYKLDTFKNNFGTFIINQDFILDTSFFNNQSVWLPFSKVESVRDFEILITNNQKLLNYIHSKCREFNVPFYIFTYKSSSRSEIKFEISKYFTEMHYLEKRINNDSDEYEYWVHQGENRITKREIVSTRITNY